MASKMNNKKLDETFRKDVKHVQKYNGIHVFWNKEGVWKRIQKAITEAGVGPKMIVWYTTMAASASLLVAASLSLEDIKFNFNSDQEITENASAPIYNEASLAITPPTVSNNYFPIDNLTIKSRTANIKLSRSQQRNIAIDQILTRRVKSQVDQGSLILKRSRNSINLRQPSFGVRFEGGFFANGRYVGSSFGFGVTMDLLKSEEITKKIYLGSSMQLIKAPGRSEGYNNALKKAYIVKAAFENSSSRNGKTAAWSSGAEFILHSTDHSVNKPMLKLFYTRGIIGKLKVGPEVLFTRNFKKVYPGITLALS